MRKFWLIVALSLTTAGLAGCKSGSAKADNGSNAGPKPGWVNGDNLDYPNSKYITATGSASNPEVAKNRALANLSKVFEAKIKAETDTMSDVKTHTQNGKEDFTRDVRVLQNINISSDRALEGARVAETWLDRSVQEHYALAVLSRDQAGRNLRQQINELDQATETDLARAKSASDALLAMAAMDKAYQAQVKRQVLQSTLKVIDLRGQGKPSQWNLASLRAELENTLLGMRISVDAKGDTTLARLVRGAMSHAGFPAVNGAGDFTMVADMDTIDVGYRQGWYWLRGKVNVKLVENASGKVRGTHSWNLKVSANSRDVASSRLISKADSEMKRDLKNIVLKFATAVGG